MDQFKNSKEVEISGSIEGHNELHLEKNNRFGYSTLSACAILWSMCSLFVVYNVFKEQWIFSLDNVIYFNIIIFINS